MFTERVQNNYETYMGLLHGEGAMSVKYIRYTDEKTEPVARKPITVGRDPAAQGFLRMFGQPTKLPGQDDYGYGDKITTDLQK